MLIGNIWAAELTLTNVHFIPALPIWAVERILALVTIDAFSIVLTVLTNATTFIVPVNIQRKLLLINFFRINTFVRMAVTITGWKCTKSDVWVWLVQWHILWKKSYVHIGRDGRSCSDATSSARILGNIQRTEYHTCCVGTDKPRFELSSDGPYGHYRYWRVRYTCNDLRSKYPWSSRSTAERNENFISVPKILKSQSNSLFW